MNCHWRSLLVLNKVIDRFYTWWWYTDPCKNSFCSVNSSAMDPANWSNAACSCGVVVTVDVVPSALKSFKLELNPQSGSTPKIEGIGLSLPTELAFELARCLKSGDSWKEPLRISRFEIIQKRANFKVDWCCHKWK